MWAEAEKIFARFMDISGQLRFFHDDIYRHLKQMHSEFQSMVPWSLSLVLVIGNASSCKMLLLHCLENEFSIFGLFGVCLKQVRYIQQLCRVVEYFSFEYQLIKEFYNETYVDRFGDVSDQYVTFTISLTTALFIPGGMIGAFLGGLLADKFGR